MGHCDCHTNWDCGKRELPAVIVGEVRWVVGLRSVRAVDFLPNGQRCETWARPGKVQCLGACWLADRDGNHSPAVMAAFALRHGDDPLRFYVSPGAWLTMKPATADELAGLTSNG